MGRKLSQLVQRYGCNLSFQRSMTDLEKIEYLLEFQSSHTTVVQDGGVKPGLDATGAQPATTGQTLTTSEHMFSQLPDGVHTYKENETVSYMIIPDYDGTGTGVNEYTQGGTVSTVNNFSMSTANDPPVYGEAPGIMPTEASNEPVPTHYVLYDDNGNEQQIMIELITQENNGTSAPEAATQVNQTTPSNAGFQVSQCPNSSYSLSSIQNEHVGSVGEPLFVHTISNTADDNQYHLPAEENNQLMLVTSQVPQEQVHIQTMNTDEVVTMGSVAGDFDPQRQHQQETLNDAVRLDAKKPYHDPPQSTVTVTTTINQQKVVTRLQDIRRSLCMARPVLTDTVSSTTPQKAPQISPVPKCQSRKTASKALPSSTIKKGKAVKPDDTVENQPPDFVNGGDSTVVSAEAGVTIDPTVSAMEEWKRIRSINRSNFDNIVRQEISRDIDLQDQEKSIQMRERKKAALRLAKLRKKMVKTEPPEPQAEPACESSAPADQPVEQNSGKPATRKRKQRALAVTAKRELKAPAEQLEKRNSTKPATRKRRQRALSVTAKRTKRSSVETVANPNDSLEKNAALLEAALYTPMKSDNDQQQQQHQQLPVSLTLTPAQQMPTETVASALESQIEALPRPETYQAVQQEQVPQSVAPDTSVTKPPSEVKTNVDITGAQHTQPTPIAMDTASPLNTSPPAAQAETKESSSETSVAQAQDETAQAVASITALAPTTPFKVKISPPIARKHLSNRKRTASSDTSSSGSSSDSECNSSCSSSSSSTTMEEDEDIRRMVQNTKRYRAGKRVQQPAGRIGPAVAIVTSNSPRKHNVIRINGGKVGQASKPQNVAPEPGDPDAATATVSRFKVVTNRQQSTAKQVQPKQKPAPKQTKQRPQPKAHAESTSPLPAPQPVSVQSAQSKKGKSPIASEKTTVTTPTRTKTPRKQQLIPTKLDSDDTFIPPTSPRVPQRPTQKSPKPPVRNRYATSRLPAAALSEKLKLAKVQRVQRADAQPVEATGLEPEEQTVDGKQQENAPVNVVPVSTSTTTPTTKTASSPKVLRPETSVCQEAIYAVLAQIHGI
uniref:Uncharacterized protein n=1 Tax=Anopheles atroparvus TaxID=41427 RepID=A0AAG5DMB6_ANOAO